MDTPCRQRLRMISTIDQALPSLISAIGADASVAKLVAQEMEEALVASLGVSDD